LANFVSLLRCPEKTSTGIPAASFPPFPSAPHKRIKLLWRRTLLLVHFQLQKMAVSPEEWFNSLPPVTKVYLVGVVCTTMAVTFKLISIYSLVLSFDMVFKKFQVSRNPFVPLAQRMILPPSAGLEAGHMLPIFRRIRNALHVPDVHIGPLFEHG
jgi:hypothetical protein